MNKNILKYFGLAALLALGVQTAEAATVATIDGKGGFETLADAFEAAGNNDVIVFAEGQHDLSGQEVINTLNGKTVTLRGASRTGVVVNWGAGIKGNGINLTGLDITIENLSLVINHGLNAASTQTEYLMNPKAQVYRNLDVTGALVVGNNALIEGCNFVQNKADTTDGNKYLIWIYGGMTTVKNCVFAQNGSGSYLKLYNSDGNFCGVTITGTQFNGEIGSKGCAVYSSNKVEKDAGPYVVYEIYMDESSQATLHAGETIAAPDGKGVSVVNCEKDANGKYTGGTFISQGTDASVEKVINYNKADGAVVAKSADGTWTVDSASAYDPTKWSGATYEAFATEPTTVEAANKFIADLPAVVKDYIAVDAANKTVALSSADAFAFITYLPKYLAALCVLDCNEKGYGDPRLSAYWVGADPKPSWTVNVTTDIDLQNQAWKPATSGYSYLVDFQNHTICNLKATGLTTNGGLFGDLYYAQNVTIDGAEVATTADNAGVLAGTLNGFAKNVSVKNATLSGGKYTGAIGGYVYGDIEDCKVVGTESAPVVITSATKEVGAVAGLFTASLIKECEVAFVSVTGQEEVGGIAGRVLDGDVKEHAIVDCSVANVTLKATKNGDAAVDSDVVGGSEANYVGLISGRDYSNTLVIMSDNKQLYPAPVANVAEVISADGTTTKGYPTLAEAFAAAESANDPAKGSTVRLLTDIDLAGVEWSPVDFRGTFDGNGKTISNLKVSGTMSTAWAGFFSFFRGFAKDVTFAAADISGNRCGVFAAQVGNSGAGNDNLVMTFDNISILNSKITGCQKCGGLIGFFAVSNGKTFIRNCTVDGLTLNNIDQDGIWQSAGMVGYLQSQAYEDVTFLDNTVKNVVCSLDGNSAGFTRTYASGAFVGRIDNGSVVDRKHGEAGYGTVTLTGNKIEGTNAGFAKGPKTNDYFGDFFTTDEINGGSIVDVLKIEVDGVDITIPAPSHSEVKIEPVDEERFVEEKTAVVDERGQMVAADDKTKEAVAKVVAEAVDEIVNNETAAKAKGTGVTEILTEVVLGEEGEEVVQVKPTIANALRKAANDVDTKDLAVGVDIVKEVEKAIEDKTATSQLNIVLESTAITVAKPVDGEEKTVKLTKVAYDVKPEAVVEIKTMDRNGNPTGIVVKTEISNAELNGREICFCLPLPNSFKKTAKVTHKSTDPSYPEEIFLVSVQGDDETGRYVNLKFTHFSEVEAEVSDEEVPVRLEGEDILGIVHYKAEDKPAGAEYAIGVPWLGINAAGEVDEVTVADIITPDGLSENDELSVWNFNKDAYDMYWWNGSEWRGSKNAVTDETPEDASIRKIGRGAAFWYNRLGGGNKDFTLIGIVSNNCSTAVAKGSKSAPKKGLHVNPFPRDTDILSKIAGSDGDQIVLVNAATGTKPYLCKNGVWGVLTPGEKITIGGMTIVKDDKFEPAAEIVIPAGQAFWYISKGGAPTINW